MESLNLGQGLTSEARRYSVKELARRAGVSNEFFETWKIDVAREQTTIDLLPDGSKRVVFCHTPKHALTNIAAGNIPLAEAAWPKPARDNLLKDNLLLPFVEPLAGSLLPLFQPSGEGCFHSSYDVLFSLLCSLARVEELLPAARDSHGRFPATASIAVRHGFLERPIVDEYGLAFEHVLSELLPSWKPNRPQLRVKLTHDIDNVGIPFVLRTSLAHTLKRRAPLATVQDFASLLTKNEPAELALVHALARISKAHGFHSAFFWKGSARTPMDSGYDPRHPKLQRVIATLKQQGFELGVHPGYSTFGSREALSREVDFLREALGTPKVGGRQHYLRWSPQTWLDWESCGLSYDSTVGFADFFGFRAGTSYPFRPWSFSENRELNLLEVPLILMDCTPVMYMRLKREEGLARIENCVRRTALVGGVFTLLWHNVPLFEPEYDGWYEAILDLLPRERNFEFPQRLESFW